MIYGHETESAHLLRVNDCISDTAQLDVIELSLSNTTH